MKNISGAFLTMLQTSTQLVQADLYTITLASGVVLRYTSAQTAIIYAGSTFLPSYLDSAPGFARGNTSCKIGLESDALEVDILFDTSTTISGQLPSAFAQGGGFDNALVRVDKALAPDWSNPVVNGVVNLFVGYVAEVKIETGKIALTVNSRIKLLNTSFPRNYFLPQCNHALFDSGCTLLASSFATAGTVSGTPTATQFNSGATQADGYFALGYVVWVTGANAGNRSFVKSFLNASGQFTLVYPLPNVPLAGDTFNAYPGCDKTQTTCSTKFSNLSHFRGYPFVPTPETLEMGGAAPAPQASGGGSGAGVAGLGRGAGGQTARFQVK